MINLALPAFMTAFNRLKSVAIIPGEAALVAG
jgi:hypothetical protein